MDFDDKGFLIPYDGVESDLETLERVFVKQMPTSATRQVIFEKYLMYLEQLRQFIPNGFTQWIDGSFVTQKLNPNDIDVITFVDYALYDKHEKDLDQLRTWRHQKPKYIDGFFVKVYPEGHTRRLHYEADRLQWLHDLSQTFRSPRQKKGFIQLSF